MSKKNYCVFDGGELREETAAGEYASYPTGKLYCIECGLMYAHEPPEHLQKRPLPPGEVEQRY